jgi:signal transduction histidine kinase
MSRRWLLPAAFALCLSVGFLAVAGLSWTVLQQNRQARKDSERAAVEESVRLALWRMDSTLGALLAREGARPADQYEPFLRPEGGGTEASPLLRERVPGVVLHFEVGDGGTLTSPQLPTGEARARALREGWVNEAQLDRAQAQLAELQRQLGTTPLLNAQDVQGQLQQQVQAQAQLNVAQDTQVAQLGGEVGNGNGSLSGSLGSQYRKGNQEYAARQRSLSNANSYNPVGWDSDTNSPRVVKGAPPVRAPPGLTASLSSALQPRFLGTALVLVRRVALHGRDDVQGVWLDREALERSLLADVSDLLPHASLEPVPAPDAAHAEHLLASLPLRLQPGHVDVVFVDDPAGASARLVLLMAWLALGLVVLALAGLGSGVTQLSERRAAFVSAVTHELRTPLTTFQLYTEMLCDGMVADPERQRTYLETLRRESSRLGHLVDNVLSYSRIERGRGQLRSERVALGDLIERQRSRLWDRVAQAGMQLEVAPVSSQAAVRADPTTVEQILFNLVDNACKYARAADDKRIAVSVVDDGRAVSLRVQDHGPGVARDVRLFEPFSKSSEAAANSAPGVGLGLALCRRLAREQGGDLRLERAAEGASFVLTLPRAE